MNNPYYNQIIDGAAEAFRKHKEWRAGRSMKDKDCTRDCPRPTGSDVVRLALGMPAEDERGTPEQEHLWAVLIDKALDQADDRKQMQPPRML